jgi:hypothetical protein
MTLFDPWGGRERGRVCSQEAQKELGIEAPEGGRCHLHPLLSVQRAWGLGTSSLFI